MDDPSPKTTAISPFFQPTVIEPLSEQTALISDESTTSNSSESSDVFDNSGDITAGNFAAPASFLAESLGVLNKMAMILVFGAICLLMNGSVKHVAGIQVIKPSTKVCDLI